MTVTRASVDTTTTAPTGSSNVPSETNPVGSTIGPDTATLAPTGYVYTGPIVVSQGPAAAFIAGVGIIGTTGGDADRHFDLAVIGVGTERRIGVRVRLTPAMVGGPDGRLYVADSDLRLSQYRIVGGRAKLTGRTANNAVCDQIEVGQLTVSCGAASIPLAPVRVGPQFTVDRLDQTSTKPIRFVGATVACLTYTGCQRWDLGNGRELWTLEIEWHDRNLLPQTALVAHWPSGQDTAMLINGSVAAFDPASNVLYAWTDIARLSTFDLAHLLG